jgi:hypothetical protein
MRNNLDKAEFRGSTKCIEIASKHNASFKNHRICNLKEIIQ